MTNKKITFSSNQLIVNNTNFNLPDFNEIVSKIEQHDKGGEIISISKIIKNNIDNRFISIYFNEGDKFPYSDTVIDANDLTEAKNPKSPNDIELNEQFFVLIDVKKQRILLSNQKKKNSLAQWLTAKSHKKITIKSIIDEKNFIDTLQTVNKISFTIEPSIFNAKGSNILSEELLQDMYGFGSEKATIDLAYNETKVTAKIVGKLKTLLKIQDEFSSITVIGHSDEKFERVFNTKEIIDKIEIDVLEDEKSKKVNEKVVFNTLISKIKEYEA